MAPRVAIIGAGPLGLMALKNMREDGLDATAYDSRAWIGGLWNYSEDNKLSVAEFTVFNSSKYRSAASDYPFPEDTADYPTWQQMHSYLNGYADHFGLRKHIKLSSPVTNLDRKDGQWVLEVSPKDGPVRQDTYDKVVVATGSFVKPKWPNFKGIEKFSGFTSHAMHFHEGKQFKDQNVLIIGLHASAQDVACTLERHAKQIYISHRNGVHLLPRYDPKGATFDTGMNLNFMFFQLFAQTWFPHLFTWLIDKAVGSMSKKAFPEQLKSWNLSPAPSMATTAPLVAEELWPMLKRGFVEPCSAVEEVTGPKSLKLKDGKVLDDIDAIIYCTGYDICAPLVPKEWNPYTKDGEPPYLYRGGFSLHPDPAVRESLAFLGHVAIPFPGFVAHETYGMAVSQVFIGNTKLPSYEEQKKWYEDYISWRRDLLRRQRTEASFYTVFVPFPDHLRFIDDAAGSDILKHFGWFSTKAWSFWWRDRALYNLVKSGLFTPSIWRLFESGKRKAWPEARAQIFKDNEIMQKQIVRKTAERKAMETKKDA